MKAVYLILYLALPLDLEAGTTGKISGTVTDKANGQALPGANVIVMGTSLGAATDTDGRYTILEVSPGTYRVQVSLVGYRRVVVEEVRVYIDQTARVNAALESEAVEAAEIAVTAERRLIKPDVATSVVTIGSDQVQQLPTMSVTSVLGLQAGIQGGWSGSLGYAATPSYLSTYTRGGVQVGGGVSIRGGGGEGILFNVDGVTLRDPRNNEPDTKIALSSVQEVNVERGGFNAEYGQVSAGIVNVVTKQGDKNEYSGRIQARIAPPAAKYWLAPGVVDLNNPMSYALRPFFDPAVCWTGTDNGAWDYYTKSKYPTFQGGWDAVSRQLNAAGTPLTPLAAQRAFEYEIRKKQPNTEPDYTIDAGFGGPVPFVSDDLGHLRFFGSYRNGRSMLIWPLSRPDYKDYDGTLQFTSDISPTMRLQVSGLYGAIFTERANWEATVGGYFYPQSAAEVANVASTVGSYVDLFTLFSDFNFSLTDIWHRSLSAKFTHTLNASTFYEILLQNYSVHYHTGPSGLRDTSATTEIVPGFYEDSNPFGYWPNNSTGILITGSQFIAIPRDNSFVSTTSIKGDISTQINYQNLLKGGVEFVYNDLNFDYGLIQSATFNAVYATRTRMHVYPYRGAFYIQDKLETQDFAMNAGLRLEYANANANWWDLDPFNQYFFSSTYSHSVSADSVFPVKTPKMQWTLSPRLGISHPISENVKLFFNYGWFRQLPQYESLFRLGRDYQTQMVNFGNPNLIMARTISYELGVDWSLSDELLFQAAAYYNDVSEQQDVVHYYATNVNYNYYGTSANSYEDRRGFELTLRKVSGPWVTGFVNYTYQVNTSGHFGASNVYDVKTLQDEFNSSTVNLYQNRPIPQPFARANLNFFTPADFGPSVAGYHLFGDWNLNVVLDWQSGYWTTWNPNGLLNIAYNVQAVDYFNSYLRLQKNISIGRMSLQVFVDVNNVLDTHRLWNTNDIDYMTSLHLPQNSAYSNVNIPGDDKVGNYRKPGAEWQPMEQIGRVDPAHPPANDKKRAIYYETTTGQYWWYQNDAWSHVPQQKINQVLDDKAYINMPNQSTFWFLDPRNFFFGLTFSFNFSE
jgi:outer membrane receptor protein involved in Fe transport